MIINWIEGLDRVFAGIQRTLTSIKTAKGNQRYYEYRRTALPYLLWFQENLPYSKLEAIYADTQDLLEVMDLATIPEPEYQFIKNNYYANLTKILNRDYNEFHESGGLTSPVDRSLKYAQQWIDIFKNNEQGNRTILSRDTIESLFPREGGLLSRTWAQVGPLYDPQGASWSASGLPSLSQLIQNNAFTDSKRKERYEVAKQITVVMERELGPVGFLYLMLSMYTSYRPHEIRQMERLFELLPFSVRKLAQLRVTKFRMKHLGARSLTQRINNYTLDIIFEKLGIPIKQIMHNTGEVMRIVHKYYAGLYSYHDRVTDMIDRIDNARKIVAKLSPDMIDEIEISLTQLQGAYQILGQLRQYNPQTDFRHGDRTGKIPTKVNYEDFEKEMKKLGFNPDLPTFEIEHCSACDGKGGVNKRICRKCSGWGVLGLPRDSKQYLPKMMYSSSDVSSYKKQEALRYAFNQRFGDLNRTAYNDIARRLEGLEEMKVILNTIKPKL